MEHGTDLAGDLSHAEWRVGVEPGRDFEEAGKTANVLMLMLTNHV